MAEYALIDRVTGEVLRYKKIAGETPPIKDELPAHKNFYLPVVRNVKPAQDPLKVVSPTVTITATEVTHGWSIRDKTPQELDDEKESQLTLAVDTLQFKVLFDHENRIRVLEGKAAISPAQFRAALKARL